MLRRTSTRIAVVVALSLLAPVVLLAQGAPINGTAQMSGSPNSATTATGGTILLTVTIDLSGVTGQGPGGSTAAVLGAYQIAVGFDKNLVRFNSANGGNTSQYSSAPVFTNPSTANSNGSVSLTASQTNSSAPTGAVSVAVLNFTALATGSNQFTLSPTSLASAFQPPSSGPTSIPGNGGNVSVTIISLPGAATNPNPADGATNVTPPTSVSWTAASGATSYDVFFGTSPNPGGFPISTTGTSVPVTTVDGTQYFWSVIAKNSAGSTPSAVFSFTTSGNAPCSIPGTPNVTASASTIASNASYKISWPGVSNATEYRIDEATNPAFTSPTSTTIPGTTNPLEKSFIHSNATDVTYYYRVVARNTLNGCTTSTTSLTVQVIVKGVPINVGIITVVGATPGSAGSFFRTALQMYNPTSSSVSGTLTYHPAGFSPTSIDPKLNYTIPAGGTISYPDLVSLMNTSGIGSIDMTSTSPLPVSVVRVFNDGGALGTNGMFFDVQTPDQALQVGQSAVLVAPIDTIATRFNIGVRSLDSGVSMNVTVKNKDGQIIKTLSKSYPGNFFTQVSDANFIESASSLFVNDTVTVTITAGSAFVYGATTDNKTNDPAYQAARRIN